MASINCIGDTLGQRHFHVGNGCSVLVDIARYGRNRSSAPSCYNARQSYGGELSCKPAMCRCWLCHGITLDLIAGYCEVPKGKSLTPAAASTTWIGFCVLSTKAAICIHHRDLFRRPEYYKTKKKSARSVSPFHYFA